VANWRIVEVTLETLLGGLPLVAILRGLTPDEAPAIAEFGVYDERG